MLIKTSLSLVLVPFSVFRKVVVRIENTNEMWGS